MTVSTELARLMADRNVTGYRLARTIGANRSNVTRWLNGSRTPEVDNLARIADALALTDAEVARVVKAARGAGEGS